MKYEEHSIGRWISILHRYRQSYINRKLESYNIGSGHYVILLALHKNGAQRQEELAGFLKIDKGSITKSVKKLEEEGYVERVVDSEDKRANRVFLTQKSLDIMPVILSIMKDWEEFMASYLTENEIELLDNLLQKMAQKISEFKSNCEAKTINEKN